MNNVLIMILLSLTISCSSMKKLAISQSVDVFNDGEKALDYESNYEFAKESALANIKTLEALHYSSPEDKGLLSFLIKGYAGYSFGVLETEAFGDILLDKSNSPKIAQVKAGYTKAIDFGIMYFELYGIKRKELLSTQGAKLVREKISSLSPEDKKALFFFAQSMAALFNLEKQNMFLLGTTALVVDVMNYVCEDDMSFEKGACHLFQAAFEASKPAMMGGSIDRANKLFKNTFKKYPKNLLNKIAYIQYSLVPMIEEDEFARLKEELVASFKEFNRVNNFGALIQKKASYPKEFNLFNAIAYERFKQLKRIEKKLF